ncbi:hypothetical protein Naga_101255g2 [Nannochloropsis gaditana]|uniref:Uncharacterized protein n=1 Tax=Nannochloropsis gaditana TaxID=72520 RepID=W7U2P2_9STRA|nr:hypothetical protein Naga_101255g2 [Nannochloropsis gaditana]
MGEGKEEKKRQKARQTEDLRIIPLSLPGRLLRHEEGGKEGREGKVGEGGKECVALGSGSLRIRRILVEGLGGGMESRMGRRRRGGKRWREGREGMVSMSILERRSTLPSRGDGAWRRLPP